MNKQYRWGLFSEEWHQIRRMGVIRFAWMILTLLIASIVVIPVVYGVIFIVFPDQKYPSPTESNGLALLSAALAGVTLWFAQYQRGDRENGEAEVKRTARFMGGLFAAAAIALALFALLSPYIVATSGGQRFFPQTGFGTFSETVTKYSAVISLLTGSVSLALATTWGGLLLLGEGVAEALKRKH